MTPIQPPKPAPCANVDAVLMQYMTDRPPTFEIEAHAWISWTADPDSDAPTPTVRDVNTWLHGLEAGGYLTRPHRTVNRWRIAPDGRALLRSYKAWRRRPVAQVDL